MSETAPLDPQTLRVHLQSLAARLGKTPTVVDLHEDDDTPYSPQQYVNQFGSWDDALDEAGLDPSDSLNKIPEHELLAELQRLEGQLGRSPTQNDMTAHGEYSPKTYQDRFGSWNNALQEAMLGLTQKLSEQELLTELERVAEQLGRVPTADEMRALGEHRPVTYHRRFGSWREAVASLDNSSRENPSTEERKARS